MRYVKIRYGLLYVNNRLDPVASRVAYIRSTPSWLPWRSFRAANYSGPAPVKRKTTPNNPEFRVYSVYITYRRIPLHYIMLCCENVSIKPVIKKRIDSPDRNVCIE